MQLLMDFDVARENLTYRKDNRRNKQENFAYDRTRHSLRVNGGTFYIESQEDGKIYIISIYTVVYSKRH